jgi:hypothetical protein
MAKTNNAPTKQPKNQQLSNDVQFLLLALNKNQSNAEPERRAARAKIKNNKREQDGS